MGRSMGLQVMHAARRLLLLLGLFRCVAAMPGGHKSPLNGSWNTGFVEEGSVGKVWTYDRQVGIWGPSRSYLVENWQSGSWWNTRYYRLDLRGKTMSYTVDLSKVGCGCIACMYLVAMPNPGPGPNYCDIQPGHSWKPCVEVDLMEANSMAYHTSLHTQPWGGEMDGTCNAILGCVANIGGYERGPSGELSKELYRPGANKIDSSRPFQVTASFEYNGHLTVTLSQDGDVVPVFNRTLAGNPMGKGIPDDAAGKVASSMAAGGLVLVTSLWNGDTHWLDKSACSGQQWCNVGRANFRISDIDVRPSPTSTVTTVTTTMTGTTLTSTTTTSTTVTFTSTTATETTLTATTVTTSTTTTSTTTVTTSTTTTNTSTSTWHLPTLGPLPTLMPLATLPPVTLPPGWSLWAKSRLFKAFPTLFPEQIVQLPAEKAVLTKDGQDELGPSLTALAPALVRSVSVDLSRKVQASPPVARELPKAGLLRSMPLSVWLMLGIGTPCAAVVLRMALARRGAARRGAARQFVRVPNVGLE